MSKRVRKDPSFDGPFAEMCRAFVSYKRSLGVQYNGQIQLLHSFDNFSKDFTVNDYEISMELAEAWSRRRHGECETHRSARILVMRHFAQYLTAKGIVPICSRSSSKAITSILLIFSHIRR